MHRLGHIGYLLAGAEFAREGQTGGVLIAIALLGWAVATELLAERTTWRGPALDQSGYGTGLRQRSADYLSVLNRFSLLSRFLAFALAAFGPLLLVWSLLL